MPGFLKPCDFQDFGETLQGDSSPGAPWRFVCFSPNWCQNFFSFELMNGGSKIFTTKNKHDMANNMQKFWRPLTFPEDQEIERKSIK